jgi:glyoxylase-like metal-dependent hydrolase (beta-lactamase superfamily II)
VKIERFVTGPFQENCYLVWDETTGEAAYVDPGDEGDRLVAAARGLHVTPVAIWITHAHLDHVGGVAPLRKAFGIPVYLHPADRELYGMAAQLAAAYGISIEQPPEPDNWLSDGEHLQLGGLDFRVMHAPGHAPGHVVIHGQGVAFVGDCLFAGSIGRSDLPLSDGRELMRSLAKIAALPRETRVLPGHGPETTIAEELRSNPFLNSLALPVRRQ